MEKERRIITGKDEVIYNERWEKARHSERWKEYIMGLEVQDENSFQYQETGFNLEDERKKDINIEDMARPGEGNNIVKK